MKSSELIDALVIALDSAVEDGRYDAILQEFDVSDGKLTIEQVKANR